MPIGLCVRCGKPAEHVHHIWPVKTHPESELDPVCGISVCKECHFVFSHKKGTECSLVELRGKVCFPIVFGKPMLASTEMPLPEGVLPFTFPSQDTTDLKEETQV